jgi:starch-binding outer membrane protein, SusD/RagB family
MKKNILTRITALFLIAVLGVGCKKDYLDLNPPSTQTPANIFATTKNAMAAINGIHRMMYSQWYGTQALGGHSGI